VTGQRWVPWVPFLAVIEPEAANVILRFAGTQLEAYASKVVAYRDSPGAAQGQSVLRALAMLERSAGEWREARAAGVPTLPGPDVVWLSTADVARELEVTTRQVLHYIDGGRGPLPATRSGGRAWRVRSEDLADFRYSRSEVTG
jgi:hypothetical protein